MSMVMRANNPVALLLAALVALSMLGAWNYATSRPAIDYYVVWAAAEVTREGHDHSLYSKEGRYRLGQHMRRKAMEEDPSSRQAAASTAKALLDSTGTPFLYATSSLFMTGDFDRDSIGWQTLLIASFVFGVLLIARLLGCSWALSFAVLLPALVWFDPFRSDLRVGNVNSVQLAAVAIICWCLSRSRDLRFVLAAGFIAACLAAYKPNQGSIAVIVLGIWLVRGQFRELGACALGMVLASLVVLLSTYLFFGTLLIWFEWLEQLSRVLASSYYIEGADTGVIRMVPRSLNSEEQALIALAMCGLLLALLAVGRWRSGLKWGQSQHDGEDRVRIESLQLVAAAGIIPLLVSSLVWTHYFVLTMPLILVSLRPWSGALERNFASLILHRVLPLVAFVLLLDGPLLALTAMPRGEFLHLTSTASLLILLFVLGWQLVVQDPVIEKSAPV